MDSVSTRNTSLRLPTEQTALIFLFTPHCILFCPIFLFCDMNNNNKMLSVSTDLSFLVIGVFIRWYLFGGHLTQWSKASVLETQFPPFVNTQQTRLGEVTGPVTCVFFPGHCPSPSCSLQGFSPCTSDTLKSPQGDRVLQTRLREEQRLREVACASHWHTAGPRHIWDGKPGL